MVVRTIILVMKYRPLEANGANTPVVSNPQKMHLAVLNLTRNMLQTVRNHMIFLAQGVWFNYR